MTWMKIDLKRDSSFSDSRKQIIDGFKMLREASKYPRYSAVISSPFRYPVISLYFTPEAVNIAKDFLSMNQAIICDPPSIVFSPDASSTFKLELGDQNEFLEKYKSLIA